jgi:pyruvate kinase
LRFKHTKIICTIGPASQDKEILRELCLNGMNIARLNFSHGDFQEHGQRLSNIRSVAKELDKEIGVLLDVRGPKIRLGDFKDPITLIQKGDTFILTTEECICDERCAFVNYPQLCEGMEPGNPVFIDDGLIELQVEEVTDKELKCRVVVGGELSSRKGVTLPGVPIKLPALTEKDIEDIKFGLAHGIDFIAGSFIRKSSDVSEIRHVIREAGYDVPIIAKIESDEGVKNIDDIIKAADGIMIARGDLGVQLPPEEIPLIQKRLISKCNMAGKPVITATQMLDSMARNARPTRAEVTDVANAIFEGTDAIMLSGETAVGRYPVIALRTMSRIALRVEDSLDYSRMLAERRHGVTGSVADAISHATCQAAMDLNVTAIITFTRTGNTARMVSKYRPQFPIIAVTPYEEVARSLSLYWGVHPIIVPRTYSIDSMIDTSVSFALKKGLVEIGDLVAVTAGVVAGGEPGSTNFLKIHQVLG